jgi:predicted MFS family arabinose efflux permease
MVVVMDTEVPIRPAGVPAIEEDPSAVPLVRGATPSGRRVLGALCSGTFVASLMFIAPTPFFPQMAPALQVSVPVLGQVMTAMLLCSALLGLVIGPLADRSGYRPVILLGLAAAALTLFTFGLAPTVLVLGVASLTGGLADAAGLGPSLALAGTHFPGTAGRRAVAWANGAEALAAIIGVPVLTAIGATAGWRVAFLAVGIGALGVLGSAVLWLPHHGRHPADRLRLETILAPYRTLLRDAGMQRLYTARALGAVCFYGFLTYLGAFLAHALGLGTEAIGLVYMLAGSAFFLGSLAVGGPLAGVPMPRLAVSGYAAMALLMGLAFSARLGPGGSIGLITAAALAMGIGIVSMITLFLAETPSGAGTTLTLGGSIFNLGAAGGGAIGGLLQAVAGYDALALGLPCFGVMAAWLCRRPQRP